jgi:hypothetical protein
MLEGKSAATIDIRTFVAANPQHGLFDTMYKAYLYSTQRGICLLFQGQDIQMEPRGWDPHRCANCLARR